MAKKKTTAPDPEKNERAKRLKETIDKIDKDFGKGTVMLLNEMPHVDGNVTPTGSFGLDLALGVGGYPRGRIIEIYGPESSGKTTLAIHAIAECQKAGGTAAVVDAEHAFDRDYAQNLGVDIDELLFSQPDYGEQALEVTDRLINSGAVDLIVVDSVAALTPKAEIDGEMGDSKMGLHARLMGQSMRKMVAIAHKNNCVVIFINQLREKIGVMFGSPETTTGGNALKFYASVRLDVRKIGVLKDGDDATGNRVKVKVIKNKVAPPFKSLEFDLIYGQGVNYPGEVLDAAEGLEIVNKNGSWYSYEGSKLGQGRNSAIQVLKDNEDVLNEIKGKILETFVKPQ